MAGAAALAAQRPHAPVVVTGGELATGHVEAYAMQDWLIERGVAPRRILVEDEARSTVDNARLTRELLPGASSVIVVTSDNHLHRAIVDFTAAFGLSVTVVGLGTETDPPASFAGVTGICKDLLNGYLA